ncbi:DUF421 domain-containing protein [Cytobacillus firmus]|uniref:DUF421 domain-containing protein n=1 Tax=Cytobacillus firmus TaxID=1399 RepID=A0AA46PU64_CYTFI|nr:YetF domain-containing protein [Cytobacillus firmus]MCS0655711.1 DUF421 domain-containing protein [Cytobacillus firmus]UYG97137.1 DUF421 domain-containing protein [Cytobacillus firmus]
MLFSSWQDIWRVLSIGAMSYIFLVIFLRIAGKRTLTKMNAFDLVVTVAIGSTLATIFLNKQVSLAEGLTAYVLLISLQYIVAWLSLHSPKFNKFIKANPELLYYRGHFVESALKENRVLRSEVLQAVRSGGHSSMDEIEAVVFETDGSMSVIQRSSSNSTMSTLSDIGQKKS